MITWDYVIQTLLPTFGDQRNAIWPEDVGLTPFVYASNSFVFRQDDYLLILLTGGNMDGATF